MYSILSGVFGLPYRLASLLITIQPTYIIIYIYIYIHYIIQSQYTIIYTRETLGNLKIKTKMSDFENAFWLASSEYRSDWLALVQSIFAAYVSVLKNAF